MTSADEIDDDVPLITQNDFSKPKVKATVINTGVNLELSFVENQPKDRKFVNKIRKQSSVTALMQEAHMKRMSIYSNGDIFKQQKNKFNSPIYECRK